MIALDERASSGAKSCKPFAPSRCWLFSLWNGKGLSSLRCFWYLLVVNLEIPSWNHLRSSEKSRQRDSMLYIFPVFKINRQRSMLHSSSSKMYRTQSSRCRGMENSHPPGVGVSALRTIEPCWSHGKAGTTCQHNHQIPTFKWDNGIKTTWRGKIAGSNTWPSCSTLQDAIRLPCWCSTSTWQDHVTMFSELHRQAECKDSGGPVGPPNA